MTTSGAAPDHVSVLVIAVLNAPALEWAASLASAVRAGADVVAVVADQADRAEEVLGPLGVRCETGSLSQSIVALGEGAWTAGVVLTDPVILPEHAFEAAVEVLAREPRVATVSFLSNSADHHSFPVANIPSPTVPPGWDENRLTRRLRTIHLPGTGVPTPVPGGAAVVVSPAAVRSLGPWEDAPLGAGLSVVDFALRAARRGLRNVLDPRTYVVRLTVPGRATFDPLRDPAGRAWITERHATGLALYDHDRLETDTPLDIALNVSRCGTLGMTVLMECDVLGPVATGTQVALLATAKALAEHPGVRDLVVGVPGGVIPRYAWDALNRPGVRVVNSSHYTFDGLSGIDVIYRPYQPQRGLPYGRWRQISRRIVCSVLDLIAYDNGAYHQTGEGWVDYRESVREAVSSVDALVTISHDVAETVRSAQLPIPDDRVMVVELGADHIDASTRQECPQSLAEPARDGRPFLLVLGAAYAHKNRDLAIGAWQQLRSQGHDVELVLAGVMTPAGSSRNDEALRTSRGPQPIVLPDVSEAEKAWLYANAALVLYPTSAEGFGLVPFEAAVYGTPTAFVSFGPLAELLPGSVGTAADWSVEAYADAVEQLLTDRAVSAAQVTATRQRMELLTWRRMAEQLVDAFMVTLRRPVLGSAELTVAVDDLRTRLSDVTPRTGRSERSRAASLLRSVRSSVVRAMRWARRAESR